MASACVNNIGVSPENFLDCPPAKYSSYGLLSPRVSLGREDSKISKSSISAPKTTAKSPDLESPPGDFEFCLDDSVNMIPVPADELFSDGKLMPLQISSVRSAPPMSFPAAVEEVRSPEKVCRRSSDASGGSLRLSLSNDPHLFSPKAPRCSSRWRELLGLKKKQESTKMASSASATSSATTSAATSGSTSTKSIRLFLHRNSRTSSSSSNSDQTLNLPLLRDSECESVSISSSRLSLSSSSSSGHGHDYDDLPRLSLDTDKPNRSSSNPNPNPNPPRVRMRPTPGPATAGSGRMGRSPMRRAQQDPATLTRGVSVDSPRMNSSGKVVFQSLERSSSSPSSFNGGRPRYNHNRGMERSYSANVVRITPVLNVPVCSLRGSSKSGVFGFGQLFASSSSSQSQKKEGGGNNGGGSGATASSRQHHHHHHYQQQHHHHQQLQNSSRNRKESS